MLILTVSNPGSLLPIVLSRTITDEQLAAIRRVLDNVLTKRELAAALLTDTDIDGILDNTEMTEA